MKILFPFILIFHFSIIEAQNIITKFPFNENFDTTIVPILPSGWKTSSTKNQSGDFTSTTSTPNSTPNAIISTDARIAQWVKTPMFSFSEKIPDKIEFYERRSSTHNSGVIFEYSFSNDTNFFRIGDSLKNISASYIKRTIQLPANLQNKDSVVFRWRVVGNGTGSTGTIRLDDVSLTVKNNIELGLQNITWSPKLPLHDDSLSVGFFVKNFGSPGEKNFSINLSIDANLDSLFDNAEIINSNNYNLFINELDSVALQVSVPKLKNGKNYIQLQLIAAADENLQNNIVKFFVDVGLQKNLVVVNEIMYDPLSNSSEYIELFNTSKFPVSLFGWKITDTPSSTGKLNLVSISKNLILQPGSFIVISADSSILETFPSLRGKTNLYILNKELSLENSGDEILIFDNTSNLIDSVKYFPTWHRTTFTKGRSLEKIISSFSANINSNWSSSVNINGGTPGDKNSILLATDTSGIEISISPNPFSPDGDGFEDFTQINFSLPFSLSNIRIRIFDRRGYLVRNLVNNEPSTSRGVFIWDGFNDEKERIRIGVYILLFEATATNGKTIFTSKKPIVVAKPL